MSRIMQHIVFAMTGSIMLGAVSPLSAAESGTDSLSHQPINIEEWQVPWPNTRPRDPFVAPDGRVWFVGQGGDYAAVFDPADASFARIDMPDGAGPHNLIVDASGIIWYAGNQAAHIGRIDPDAASGEQIRQYPTPKDQAKDPHTLIQASDGRIWFTAQWSNSIGVFDPATGSVNMLDVPTARARPYGIDLDSNGHPWVVLLGSNKLVHIDPASMRLQEIELPRADARPRRIAITSDDRICYVDYAEGYLGCYQPGQQQFSEWPTPGRSHSGAGASGPYAMAVDNHDRLWFVETFPDPNRFVGFDLASASFISVTGIPSGAGAVRHMVFDAERNAIWFGTDTNMLGRADLPE